MNLLLHTIALEPARWTPQRVSRPLLELLPTIAAGGFNLLEIYEPHLERADDPAALRETMGRLKLSPIVLSSYLNLNPEKTPDAMLSCAIEQLAHRLDFFGFQKLRLFPGPQSAPADGAAVRKFTDRLRELIQSIPRTQVLLETHDGSLADDPMVIAKIAEEFASENVGLLYQPTFFEPDRALEQFRIQKPFVRHFHLQNRKQDLSFETLEKGVIPWPEILNQAGGDVDASLEFVPSGICSVEEFDLATTIEELRMEADYVRTIRARGG